MAQNHPPPPPPQQSGNPQYGGQSAAKNSVALQAMIMGIVAIVLNFGVVVFPAGVQVTVGWIAIGLGVAALIMGIRGLSRARELGGAGRGQAITGIVLGSIMIVLFLIGVVIGAALVSSA